MSRRRELESRLALYAELTGILGAMRSFALAELRRIAQREAAQQQAVEALSHAFREMAQALPQPDGSDGDIWILLGSARGFCASFNEDIYSVWKRNRSALLATIVVGERLAALMPDDAAPVPVAGAIGAADTASAIDRMLAAVAEARKTAGDHAGLVICFRDDAGARAQRLLPYSLEAGRNGGDLPLTNEPASRVATGVAQHYLFHLLLSLLLRSLRMENQMRLMQMENALQHIERNSEPLERLRNRLRQEEIVEEVELIFQHKR